MSRFHDGLGDMRPQHENFGRALLVTWTLSRALIASAALSLLLTGCGHQPKSAVRASEADALRALAVRVDERAGEDEFSGAVLVAKDGRVRFSHAYGLADRKRRIRNTLATRFRVGSMNKMFTAVAILQLVEAGKVRLTAPLGNYLPDYPNGRSPPRSPSITF